MPNKTDTNISLTPQEYIRRKALKFLGLIDTNVNPQKQADRLTFVNNINDIKTERLKEYNVWYSGDSDEIMNYYTRAETIDYNTDPLYYRNKRCYFWSVASTEDDIKRTHSGQPRNIVDTLVNIVGLPKISMSDEKLNEKLQEILEDNEYIDTFIQNETDIVVYELDEPVPQRHIYLVKKKGMPLGFAAHALETLIEAK